MDCGRDKADVLQFVADSKCSVILGSGWPTVNTFVPVSWQHKNRQVMTQ